jgi:hypothetical protein
MTWRAVAALALLGAFASPALAVAPPGMRWMISHDGDRIAAMPLDDDSAASDRVEGKVLAVDPQHGRFLLGTDAGMIAMRTTSEDIAEMQIGQTLEVEMATTSRGATGGS